MSASRDSFSKIRAFAGIKVKQALAQTKSHAAEADKVYSRARLQRAEITEDYSIEQEISVSPAERTNAKPTGKIELAIPYDGHKYFTREAREDVVWGASGSGSRNDTAVIGHLLLHAYEKTTLSQDLALPDRQGSLPIEVMLGHGGQADFSQLSADRQTCVTTYEFAPDEPAVLPGKLEIDLYDPDSLDLLRQDLAGLDMSTEESRRRVNDLIGKIRQQVSFRNDLILRIVVHLSIPVESETENPQPKVARMAIQWPTITSLRTLNLHIGDRRRGNSSDVILREAPVRYNPEKTCLEWEGIRMFARPRKPRDEHIHYESAPMLLSVQHPGELYRQKKLEIDAKVKIPGYLLSGLDARLYDATGRLAEDLQPRLTTSVHVHATLMLDDAFAKRDFTPSQHLFFDEIIPDEMRITDIRNSLDERGFKVWPPKIEPLPGNRPDTIRWFLAAQRQEGPDTMDLWIFVEGKHFETLEEKKVLDGRKTNTTKRHSGELQVSIRGALARDSRELTHEMNALARTLRERYGRVR